MEEQNRLVEITFFAMIPSGLWVLAAGLWAAGRMGGLAPIAALAGYEEMLPIGAAGLALAGLLGAAWLRSRLIESIAASGTMTAAEFLQRARSAVTVYAAVAEAPGLIALTAYALLPAPWLLVSTAAYAALAAALLRPEVAKWYDELRRRGQIRA
ncbi:MAG: hypothetical protein HYY28_08650 [Betaproteobacteria bacterium]|nr:hypothetical protein [Betaproteobacteria bacterium]MBI2960368.1 hypothetical protein [Betaproteobacteria bacterium]